MVILLVAIGNGVQTSVNERIQPLANLIIVVPTAGNVAGGAPKNLIDADVAALQNPDRAPDVASVTPATTGQTVVETDTTESRTFVIGSTERWFEANNRKLQIGSFLDEAQVRSTAKVVVLGTTTVDNLFGGDPADALGRPVRINRQTFRGIGGHGRCACLARRSGGAGRTAPWDGPAPRHHLGCPGSAAERGAVPGGGDRGRRLGRADASRRAAVHVGGWRCFWALLDADETAVRRGWQPRAARRPPRVAAGSNG